VVDEETGRASPRRAADDQRDRLYTDSAGVVAFLEPASWAEGLLSVKSTGTSTQGLPGLRGVSLLTAPGRPRRESSPGERCERLYRVTGQGIYRDSVLLGLPCPHGAALGREVAGQDTVMATVYRGKITGSGDTSRIAYGLGHFGTGGPSRSCREARLDRSVASTEVLRGPDGFSRPCARSGQA